MNLDDARVVNALLPLLRRGDCVVEGAQRANAVALEVAGEVVAGGPKREARGSILEHFEPGPARGQTHPRTLLDGRGQRS
jgi:hypothetical protein